MAPKLEPKFCGLVERSGTKEYDIVDLPTVHKLEVMPAGVFLVTENLLGTV